MAAASASNARAWSRPRRVCAFASAGKSYLSPRQRRGRRAPSARRRRVSTRGPRAAPPSASSREEASRAATRRLRSSPSEQSPASAVTARGARARRGSERAPLARERGELGLDAAAHPEHLRERRGAELGQVLELAARPAQALAQRPRLLLQRLRLERGRRGGPGPDAGAGGPPVVGLVRADPGRREHQVRRGMRARGRARPGAGRAVRVAHPGRRAE